ncbi:hypothetical protein JOL79_02950 [Microbispora sp. RL4-1S]|uniref:Uncharacterized protein n=1 Tax=Microbispora oryzae TaxID=2806554 RepID=A0A940WLH0_9ACTN|nr:hypothetical protein [Microbispora oryzae]MBP2702759.1 hypothetical protein [Microbispora oryzae]
MNDNVLVLGIIIAATVLLIVAIWQVTAAYRARALISREQSFRTLSEESAAAMGRVADELTELRERVASLERLLKEID